MKFRIYNKREDYHIYDCEYLLDQKGNILFQYIDSHGGICLIPCLTQYVVQYSTGLTDVYGRQIFEGDWIEWEEMGGYGIGGAADKTRNAQVVFSPKLAQFVLDTSGRHLIDDKYGDYRSMHYQDRYKIIKKP